MKAIINKEVPEKAIKRLNDFAEIITFESDGITYDAVSGHADVFMCQISNNVFVVAPNIPDKFLNKIDKHDIEVIKGHNLVGQKHPASVHYNALVTKNLLIHNLDICDHAILETCKEKKHIHVNQAYTRCNLISLNEDVFITSDKGIEKTLSNEGLNVEYFDPHEIVLPGFYYGFIGGTMGVVDKEVFIVGSLSSNKQGERLKHLIDNSGYTLHELYDGKWFDAGSIFFIK
jgi:hypothetical protein